jgi:acetoin utilization deacetylase AcuC-like enzyme
MDTVSSSSVLYIDLSNETREHGGSKWECSRRTDVIRQHFSDSIASVLVRKSNNALLPNLSPEQMLAILSKLHDSSYIQKLPLSKEQFETQLALAQTQKRTLSSQSFYLAGDSKNKCGIKLGTVTALGACISSIVYAVEQMVNQRAVHSVLLLRPPGHHVGWNGPVKNNGNGFCLINNVMLAATQWLERRPNAKIAIIDPDVHYAAGTQDILKHLVASKRMRAEQVLMFDPHRGRKAKSEKH